VVTTIPLSASTGVASHAYAQPSGNRPESWLAFEGGPHPTRARRVQARKGR
jgi:hypothetical protein